MTDERSAETAPTWFTIAAIAALLWEVLGCAMYLMQVLADPASLPRDQQALALATPSWMTATYGVAVWVGLVGAILLVARNRKAEPLLMVSLLAVLVQFSGLLIVRELRQSTPSDAFFLPFVIALVSYAVWHLAWRARRAGWLR